MSVHSCRRSCRGLFSIGLENFEATPPQAEALPSAWLTPLGLVRATQTLVATPASGADAILLHVQGKAKVPVAAFGEPTTCGRSRFSMKRERQSPRRQKIRTDADHLAHGLHHERGMAG